MFLNVSFRQIVPLVAYSSYLTGLLKKLHQQAESFLVKVRKKQIFFFQNGGCTQNDPLETKNDNPAKNSMQKDSKVFALHPKNETKKNYFQKRRFLEVYDGHAESILHKRAETISPKILSLFTKSLKKLPNKTVFAKVIFPQRLLSTDRMQF